MYTVLYNQKLYSYIFQCIYSFDNFLCSINFFNPVTCNSAPGSFIVLHTGRLDILLYQFRSLGYLGNNKIYETKVS